MDERRLSDEKHPFPAESHRLIQRGKQALKNQVAKYL